MLFEGREQTAGVLAVSSSRILLISLRSSYSSSRISLLDSKTSVGSMKHGLSCRGLIVNKARSLSFYVPQQPELPFARYGLSSDTSSPIQPLLRADLRMVSSFFPNPCLFRNQSLFLNARQLRGGRVTDLATRSSIMRSMASVISLFDPDGLGILS
jgi:hypothetical protein